MGSVLAAVGTALPGDAHPDHRHHLHRHGGLGRHRHRRHPGRAVHAREHRHGRHGRRRRRCSPGASGARWRSPSTKTSCAATSATSSSPTAWPWPRRSCTSARSTACWRRPAALLRLLRVRDAQGRGRPGRGHEAALLPPSPGDAAPAPASSCRSAPRSLGARLAPERQHAASGRPRSSRRRSRPAGEPLGMACRAPGPPSRTPVTTSTNGGRPLEGAAAVRRARSVVALRRDDEQHRRSLRDDRARVGIVSSPPCPAAGRCWASGERPTVRPTALSSCAATVDCMP